MAAPFERLIELMIWMRILERLGGGGGAAAGGCEVTVNVEAPAVVSQPKRYEWVVRPLCYAGIEATMVEPVPGTLEGVVEAVAVPASGATVAGSLVAVPVPLPTGELVMPSLSGEVSAQQ